MEETLSDSRGSFLNTKVKPFCLEKTRMMKADSLISERVICNGMVKPDLITTVSQVFGSLAIRSLRCCKRLRRRKRRLHREIGIEGVCLRPR